MVLLLCFSLSSTAQPIFPELQRTLNSELQAGLVKLLKDKHLDKFVKQKKIALVIADLSDLEHPRFAHVNGNNMMYAASLPKIAILVAAFVEIDRGQLLLDDKLWHDLNRMIRHSDNAAATRVLERVGKEKLLSILQEPKYHFYDEKHGGGLWVGKAYSKSGAYHRDPLKNLSHAATAIQAARVYYLLASGQLLSPDSSKKMLEVLAKPAINHKLVKGLRPAYPNATIYRKSGTWRNYHADSAMIENEGNRYLIIGLVDHPDGGQWLVDLAEPLMVLLKQSASEEKH